jgi:hypothetical protein
MGLKIGVRSYLNYGNSLIEQAMLLPLWVV